MMPSRQRLPALAAAVLALALAACQNDGAIPTAPNTDGAAASVRPDSPIRLRPIRDFVRTQGTFCIPKEGGGCLLIVPPVKNFLGFSDPARNRCASVDYAGLADRWLREVSDGRRSFGTRFDGTVVERTLENGRAFVRVILRTTHALSWSVNEGPSGSCDYANGPLLFGHRAPAVRQGATPAFGTSVLEVTFINTRPGAPLPDLMRFVVRGGTLPGQRLLTLRFYAVATGPLRRPFGVPDGTPGRMIVDQFCHSGGAVCPDEDVLLRRLR